MDEINLTMPVILEGTHDQTHAILHANEGERANVWYCNTEAEADEHIRHFERTGTLRFYNTLSGITETVEPLYVLKVQIQRAMTKQFRSVTMENLNVIEQK